MWRSGRDGDTFPAFTIRIFRTEPDDGAIRRPERIVQPGEDDR